MCFNATDREALSHPKVDMGSLMCATILVLAVHRPSLHRKLWVVEIFVEKTSPRMVWLNDYSLFLGACACWCLCKLADMGLSFSVDAGQRSRVIHLHFTVWSGYLQLCRWMLMPKALWWGPKNKLFLCKHFVRCRCQPLILNHGFCLDFFFFSLS